MFISLKVLHLYPGTGFIIVPFKEKEARINVNEIISITEESSQALKKEEVDALRDEKENNEKRVKEINEKIEELREKEKKEDKETKKEVIAEINELHDEAQKLANHKPEMPKAIDVDCIKIRTKDISYFTDKNQMSYLDEKCLNL